MATYKLTDPETGQTFRYDNSLRPLGTLYKLMQNDLPEAAHYALFLGYIGFRLGVLDIDEVAGDLSIPHALAHFNADIQHYEAKDSNDIEDLKTQVNHFESRIFQEHKKLD